MLILVSNSSGSRLMYLIDQSVMIVYQSHSVLSNILSASLLLVIAYSLGHIIATISHIVVDRLLVSGILGYPMHRLLHLPKQSDHYKIKRSTSIYLFVVILMVLFPPLLHYHLGTLIPLDDQNCSDLSVLCNPCYYKWLFGALAFFALFKIIHAFLAAEPFYARPSKFFKWPWFAKLTIVYTWPAQHVFVPLIHVVETLLGTERQFPKALVREYSAKYKKRFGFEPAEAGTENYWLPFFQMNVSDPGAARLVFNWLHIYGFARNMAAACFITLAYVLYKLHRLEGGEGDYKLMLVVYVLNFYLMVFFLVRYWLIYSTYFSKSIIRAFVVNEGRDGNTTGDSQA